MSDHHMSNACVPLRVSRCFLVDDVDNGLMNHLMISKGFYIRFVFALCSMYLLKKGCHNFTSVIFDASLHLVYFISNAAQKD